MDRETIRLLRVMLDDLDGQLRRLADREGAGAAVRRVQLASTRLAIASRISETWRGLGNAVEANAARAAAEAARANAGWDADFLARLGFSRAAAAEFAAGAEAAAADAVQRALNRRFDTSGTTNRALSGRVYDSSNLANRLVQRRIESALGRGLSNRELAREIRGLIRPDVRGGVSYAARRLARTEINNSFHYSQIQNAMGKPWVTGLRWNLSSSHPKPDTCDSLSQTGSPGLEPGVYRPQDAPQKPHPQCLCFLEPVTMNPAEFERRLRAGEFESWTNSNLPRQ